MKLSPWNQETNHTVGLRHMHIPAGVFRFPNRKLIAFRSEKGQKFDTIGSDKIMSLSLSGLYESVFTVTKLDSFQGMDRRGITKQRNAVRG